LSHIVASPDDRGRRATRLVWTKREPPQCAEGTVARAEDSHGRFGEPSSRRGQGPDPAASGHDRLRCAGLPGGGRLDLLHTWTARSDAIAYGEETTANLARSIAQHAEDTIRTTDGVPDRTGRASETGRQDDPAMDRLRRLFEVQVSSLPQLKGLAFLDEKGDPLVSSLPMLRKINLAIATISNFTRATRTEDAHLGGRSEQD